MGSELSADQLEELKSGNACVVRNPISVSYGEEPLEFTSIEAGSTICVAGADLAVLETLDGYEGYLGIGNGGFTNGVQVIVDDSIYEQLTGKNTYSEFLPTLNKDVDRETFDTFVEDFVSRHRGQHSCRMKKPTSSYKRALLKFKCWHGADPFCRSDWYSQYYQYRLHQYPHPSNGNWYAESHWYECVKSLQDFSLGRCILRDNCFCNWQYSGIYLYDLY